jgi:hypothetical protein
MSYVINEVELNCFHFIKNVLDELYDELPFSNENAKDEAIFYELKDLRDRYPELINGVTINYSAPITRFAYIYRYVATHAFTTYALLKGVPELGSLFNMSQISVSCLGGGPGSDLLGILKYIKSKNKPITLKCRVYDREERWRESLSSVCNHLTSFYILPTFRTLDVIDAETWNKYPELLDSNLFTMSFFISELCSRQEQAEDFFVSLFKNAKKFSLFLFIDNSSGHSRVWFDKLVKVHNQSGRYGQLHLIKKSEKHRFYLEDGEQAKDLEPYYSKFGDPGRSKLNEVELPKSNPMVDYRIYRKV